MTSSASNVASASHNSHVDDNVAKAEVIDVGGAWKVTLKESSAVTTSVEGEIVEIPLEDKKEPLPLSELLLIPCC